MMGNEKTLLLFIFTKPSSFAFLQPSNWKQLLAGMEEFYKMKIATALEDRKLKNVQTEFGKNQ